MTSYWSEQKRQKAVQNIASADSEYDKKPKATLCPLFNEFLLMAIDIKETILNLRAQYSWILKADWSASVE